MNRLARRARARSGRAAWPMLLVVGGLLACGGERPDAVSEDAIVAAAKPAPVGECRRFTTCVPENPCHTGWVTGCRRNVPVCTDIGGWLDNGAGCGSGAVCYMGQCLPCAAGESCLVRDQWQNEIACRAGVISCASGQPVCQDAGPAADGRLCTEGGYEAYVCKGGACIWCLNGESCFLPEQPCHTAVMAQCRENGGTCTDTGTFRYDGDYCPYRDGNWYTGVCSGGSCLSCEWWSACVPPAPTNECLDQSTEGSTQCYGGTPTCVAYSTWPKADGTPCSAGVCSGGTCLPLCVPGLPCTEGCWTGLTACGSPTWGYCALSGTLPDGTGCGAGAFCSAGSCVACGGWCAAADHCHAPGTLSCDTGLCASPTLPDRTSCGAASETCAGGVCAGLAGAPIRTAGRYGPIDLTGVTWTRCEADWVASTSRRSSDTYGLGTLTHVEENFPASTDCSGALDEATSWTAVVSATSAGYRDVGWEGSPPPGAWSPTTATAVHLVGEVPGMGPVDLKFLVWVDDSTPVRVLYQGEDKNGAAPDGYPLRLIPYGKGEVVSICGAPCEPGFPTCDQYAWDCSGGAPACAATGATLAEREPCGNGSYCLTVAPAPIACTAVATRTITGTSQTTFWSDAGAFPPVDHYAWWKSAVVFTGQTSTERREADTVGSPWSIANVPSATYILQLSNVAPRWNTHEILSNRGSFEAGIDVLGRPDASWNWDAPIPVTLTVQGLVPVRRFDVVGLVCSNVGVALQPFGNAGSALLPLDAESAFGTVQWLQLPRIDGAMGDVVYLFQGATTFDAESASTVTALARWGVLPDWFAIGTAPVGADVTLEPCTDTSTFTADWRLSQFAAYAGQVHPDATVRLSQLGVWARPHDSPFAPGWVNGDAFNGPGIPLVVFRPGRRTDDLVSSGVAYGRFLPPLWRDYRLARTQFNVPFTAPGASRPAMLQASLGSVEPADGASTPVVPAVSPPRALRVGDQDAMAGAAHVGLMPLVSWSAPDVLPASPPPIYEVVVYEVIHGPDAAGTQLLERYRGETTRTSFRLPGTNLHWTGRYVVAVTVNVSDATLASPLRESVVRSFATAVSREFTP